MSRIFKREGSPYWQYTSGTPPYRIKRSTKQTNKALAKQIQKEWDRESIFGIVDFNITVSKFITIYSEYVRNEKKPRWAVNIIGGLNHLRRLYGHIRLRNLQDQHISEYKRTRQGEGISPTRIHHELGFINGMFEYAIYKGCAIRNPTKLVSKPQKIPLVERTNLPIKVVKEIIDEESVNRDKSIFSLALYTGMRSGDLCTLKQENIQNGYIDWKVSKNNKRCVLPMHPSLKSMDLIMLAANQNKKKMAGAKFRDLLKAKCGIYGTLHSLRHTFATRLDELGASHLEIKYMMGHTMDDITWRYIHKNVDSLKKYIDAI